MSIDKLLRVPLFIRMIALLQSMFLYVHPKTISLSAAYFFVADYWRVTIHWSKKKKKIHSFTACCWITLLLLRLVISNFI